MTLETASMSVFPSRSKRKPLRRRFGSLPSSWIFTSSSYGEISPLDSMSEVFGVMGMISRMAVRPLYPEKRHSGQPPALASKTGIEAQESSRLKVRRFSSETPGLASLQ